MILICVGMGCVGSVFPVEHSAIAQTPVTAPTQYWVNVRDYGAVGDAVHDDGPAISSALSAAAGGSRVVYFPPSRGYYISSVTLPPGRGGWMKLYLDAPIYSGSTIKIPQYYSIYGDSSEPPAQFSQNDGAWIQNRNPALTGAIIDVTGPHVSLENVYVGGAPNDADTIVTEPSICCVRFKDVSVQVLADNTSGSAVRIEGGFGFVFEGGYYADSNAPAIRFGPDPRACNATGIVRMQDTVLNGHGIAMTFDSCGVAGPYTFENVLYEGAEDSFLTISERGGSWVRGIYMRNIILSDCRVGPTCPAMVTNNGKNTSGVQIINSWGPWDPATPFIAGDSVHGLEIWSPFDLPVGQASEYVYHLPDRVVSTLPTVDPATRALQPRGTPRHASGWPRADE